MTDQRMGLAVSLVAAPGVRERVWFCAKGKKPPQKDTRDFDKGGNCVWCDGATRSMRATTRERETEPRPATTRHD